MFGDSTHRSPLCPVEVEVKAAPTLADIADVYGTGDPTLARRAMYATVSIASTDTTSPVSEKRVSCTKVCTWPLTSATSPRYHRITSRACLHAMRIAPQ